MKHRSLILIQQNTTSTYDVYFVHYSCHDITVLVMSSCLFIHWIDSPTYYRLHSEVERWKSGFSTVLSNPLQAGYMSDAGHTHTEGHCPSRS